MTNFRYYLKHLFNILLKVFVFLSLCLLFSFLAEIEGHCQNVSIVIDPGHGGDAMGGNYEDRIERDINLITALAMKERLEMYEGVDVYITRDNNTDAEMSRKQRFVFAQNVNADFLISVHYNMSEYHTLYGSEVWVASKGNNYVKGYAYATLEMESFKELGLFDRGIKNKLDKNKTGEYYGILKYAEDYSIPSVIVEHCHLDEERDSAFWNEESYKQFGVIDADNMAKLFNLSSSTLGIDNSHFENIIVEKPSGRLDVDSTEPEECEISVIEENDTSVSVEIQAYDSDTYIQYYQISLDGGNNFGRLEGWTDRASKTEIISVDKIEDDIELVIKTYNQYEGSKTSNSLHIERLEQSVEQEIIEPSPEVETIETKIVLTNKTEKEISPVVVLFVTMIVLFITFNIVFAIMVLSHKKRRRKTVRNKSIDEFDWEE